MSSTVTVPRLRVGEPKPTAPVTVPWSRRDTVVTAAIGFLALFTRFVGLTSAKSNGTPVFDEKHYVPQAWDIARSWFNPILGGIESNPGYGLVVHPPLAKRIEALGEMVFGYTPLGWRVMAAFFASAVVVFTMLLARRLSQSWVIALFAGVMALCDGVLLVIGRFGMLDVFILLFVVMAAWTLAGDMRQVHQRFHDAYLNGEINPRLGFRWWRFATGVLLGCALAVKWSGLYYIAFFGLLSSFYDLWLRRRYGVSNPVRETLLKDVPSALASIVLIPAVLYVWSWRAWFASETAVYRHSLSDGTIANSDWPGLAKLPEAVAGWLYYHFSVLKFHSELTSSSGHSHPWDSKPWSWLVASRPILYYSSTGIECAGGQECRRMIYLFGTPAIWWLTVPVLLWAIWAWISRGERRVIIPLIGFAAGFLPWLAAFDRQMYFFYAGPLVPFTIVLLALALGELSKHGKPVQRISKIAGPMTTGQLGVVAYLSVVIGMFLYFSPILYGFVIPDSIYDQLMWLPSWK